MLFLSNSLVVACFGFNALDVLPHECKQATFYKRNQIEIWVAYHKIMKNDEAQGAGPILDTLGVLRNSTPVSFCLADITGNGQVDIQDLLAVLAAWGTADSDADIAPPGGDGVVDIQDLLALLAGWGACPRPEG